MSEEVYVDMESYGVDFISKKEKIPHCIIKFPFDTVSLESLSVDKNAITQKLENYDYSNLLTNIYTWCQDNILPEPDWEKYKQQFSFTVAELEIFKKQYNKLIAFGIDSEEFLEENKNESKKSILQKMIDTEDAK